MINVHIVKKRMEFGAWWMFRHIPREKENIPIVSIEKNKGKSHVSTEVMEQFKKIHIWWVVD